MQRLFLILIPLVLCSSVWAQMEKNQIMWDNGVLPPNWPKENPYGMYATMNCTVKPVLDHTGKPHHHGHVAQLIMDGGNGVQDPPKVDGMPGGDDTLAFGNFNMVRILGLDAYDDPNGETGTFYSKRAFVPFVPNRSYYMRVWEGPDPNSAPYYQDTIEYTTSDDHGGAMFTPSPGLPTEVDWVFGVTKPRPDSTLKKDSSK